MVVRLWHGRVSARIGRRGAVVSVCLVALAAVALVTALFVGSYPISFGGVFRALVGEGSRQQLYFVNDVRLPRALVALLVGAALAVAGAIFQSLTGNPLGSPDIIGFNGGAAAGALIVMLVLDESNLLSTGIGAVLGGAVVAVLVYVLAYRDGVQGYRLVLVGVGVSALLSAGIAYLLSRAELTDSMNAQVWMVGSLNGRGWEQVWTLVAALAVALPAAFALNRRLVALELGEETATALGLSARRTRQSAIAVTVVLSAAAVATAGPITFVALAAPQIAKRLARSAGPSLVTSALTGACLLVLADVLAQTVIPQIQLPVGVATVMLGGLYLGWLLVGETRRGRA